MLPTITAKQIEALGAYPEQVALFRKVFRSRAVCSVLNLKKALAKGLDVSWLARRTLNASARAEYDKVCASAWAEYDKVCVPARAEFDKICASAWAEYDKICAPARAEYDKVRASAWLKLYRSPKNRV